MRCLHFDYFSDRRYSFLFLINEIMFLLNCKNCRICPFSDAFCFLRSCFPVLLAGKNTNRDKSCPKGLQLSLKTHQSENTGKKTIT